MGQVMDLLKKIVPFETPISVEAMGYVTQWTPASSEKYLRHSRLHFREPADTLTDTVRWLAASGHLKTKFAPRVAVHP